MFTVLVDQIEYLENFFVSYKVIVSVQSMRQMIIQFSERKLIDQNRCEWSFNAISPVNSMLRRYDAVDHILIFNRFRMLSYTF